MKKIIISFMISFSIIISPLLSYSRVTATIPPAQAPTTTTTTTQAAVVTTTVAAGPPTTAPSMLNAAYKSQEAQGSGIGRIIIFAGVAAAAVAVSCPWSSGNCAMWTFGAALAGAALAAMTRSKGKATTSCQAVSANGQCNYGFDIPTTTNPYNVTTTTNEYGGNDDETTTTGRSQDNPYEVAQSTLDNLYKSLQEKGIKIDPKNMTVTMPNGKTYTADNFSSPSSMSAAGFSGEDIAKFDKIKNDLNEAVKKEIGGTDSFTGGVSAGGGAGAGGGGGDIALASAMTGYVPPQAPSIAQQQDLIAGTAVLFNGELVGSANGGTIWELNTRRIDNLENNNQLLPP